MKNRISKLRYVAFLLMLLLMVVGCEKSPTIVKNDDGGETEEDSQTLIIDRNSVEDKFDDDYLMDEMEINDYARLYITHRNSETSQIKADNGHFYSGTYASAFANLYTVRDKENIKGLDYGTVTLGGVNIPLLDTTHVKYFMDDKIIYPVYQIYDQVNLDFFTGSTLLSTSNGVDVQDINEELELPERNYITNVNWVDQIDVNEDWVVRFKNPIIPENSVILIYEHALKYYQNDRSNRYEGVPHVIIRVTEPATEITIPKEELVRLEEESEVDDFVIKMSEGLQFIKTIQILDNNNQLIDNLDVVSSQSDAIQVKLVK